MKEEIMKKSTKNILAVLSAAFMSFVGILTETSLNVTFPTMMKEFKVSLDTIQWTTTGYLLMIAIIMICSSYLNDRFTARQLFIIACVGFMVGSVISAIAPNFPILLLGRLISALGAGLSTPLMFNLVTEIMPRSKWGVYMGIAGLVVAMAPTLGPAFGGITTFYLNWRWIFVFVTIFALIAFVAGTPVIGKYHDLKLSQKSSKKLLDLAVFKQKAFVFGALAYFLLQFNNIGISFVLPNYIQIVGKQSSLVGGLVLLPGSIIAGLLNPYFGSLYDKRGAKLPLYLGGFFMALSCLLFAIFGLNLSAMMIIIFYGIMMMGHRMSFSNTMAEALKVETGKLRADATAVCQTSQQLAGSVGTTILASIMSVWQKQGHGSYIMATAQGSQAAFCFTLLMSLIIMFSYWKMFRAEKAK
jgi:MFS family permease